MILLKRLTLGSRKYFLPESPSLQMIACCTRRFRRYSLRFSRDPCAYRLTIPYHWYNLMDNYVQFSFIPSFSVALVITRCPKLLSVVPKILYTYCLAVLYHMNIPIENSSHLSSIRSSPVVHAFHKSLQNTIRSSKNLMEPLALEILACSHYG